MLLLALGGFLFRAISLRAAAFIPLFASAFWCLFSFLWHLGLSYCSSKFLNIFYHIPKLKLLHKEMLIFLAVELWETTPLVP